MRVDMHIARGSHYFPVALPLLLLLRIYSFKQIIHESKVCFLVLFTFGVATQRLTGPLGSPALLFHSNKWKSTLQAAQ